MLGRWRAARFCIAVLLIIVILFSNNSPRTPSSSPAQAQTPSFATNVSPSNSTSPAIVGFTPSSIADIGIATGQNVSFTLTVTNSTPIDGFAVFIHYNEQVLRVNTIDYSNNVLGSKADIFEECVDHTSLVQGLQCTPLDNPGVISLTLSLLGNATTPSNTTGTLFQIRFNVFGQGFSALHIIQATLANGNTGESIPLKTLDAYFSNTDCPSGSNAVCKPPIANLTYSPVPSFVNRPVTFNSSAVATNLQASIAFLTWDFGDNGPTQNSTIGAGGRPLSSIQHIYPRTCTCSVTLAVVDSYGIAAFATIVVHVTSVFIDLLVSNVLAKPQFRVYPGAIVVIGVVVVNNSTFPEDGTVSVDVDGHVVAASQSYSLRAFRQQTTISVNWNTTNYTPRVYRIHATIPPILNENKTTNNDASAFVELISQRPSGSLSLSLLQTGGLGILVLAGLGFGVSRLLRRKPGFEEDAYETK